MIDIELLRKEPARVRTAIGAKNCDPALVDTFTELDSKWREATRALEVLRAEQNELSKKREIEAAKANKQKIKEQEDILSGIEAERKSVWQKIPNLPTSDTPVGKDEGANQVLRTVGEPTKFNFKPQDHLALGESLGLISTDIAGKVSGTRFAYLKGDAARLEFALVQYAFETLGDENRLKVIADKVRPGYPAKAFIPVVPPVMIRPEVFDRMARLEPKEERYYISSDDVYLIGSAEHTLGPLHLDETVAESELPLRYVGFSTSFRREAGSYGKDTRGILRVHQFDKVELESFTAPTDGIFEQEFFVAIQEHLMSELGIPYRVVICSTGDQGDPDARHLDIECWLPSENKYRETHSADYMTDYQTRRLNTKVKRKDGKPEFVHTNDATCFAIGRTLIAIMENNQTAEGKIRIPKVLQKYVGKEIIE